MTSVSIDRNPAGDALLCRILAGGELPAEASAGSLGPLWTRAQFHDVDVLMAAALVRSKEPMCEALRAQALTRLGDAQLRDLLRHRELCRLTARFADADVDLLLLKGAGLAYTVYPEPYLRQSRDVDLFIRRSARSRAEEALAACGYARMREPDGEFASAQRHYVRRDAAGINHFVDLHWAVSDVRPFADALGFDEAWSASIVIPALGPAARTPGIEEALLLACLHRVAHHQDALDLRWLWDIHLLAECLPPAGWTTFVGRALRTRMCAPSLRGLELARVSFGTGIPADVRARLDAAAATEPSARFLGGRLRRIDIIRADLAATAGWRKRGTLLREHLFPSRSYMRAIYPRWPSRLLAAAYVDRIVRGAPGWFRRPTSADAPRG